MKGVYELRPVLSKHQEIWDVKTVLEFLQTLHPVEGLTLKNMTLKLTMLLALTSAQRCQTLQASSLDNMRLANDECTFYFTKLLKTFRPGKHQSPLVLKALTPREQICPIKALREYVKRTKNLRAQEDQLLISYQQPHKGVETDTISRWLKDILQQAGIDNFTGHSTRAASSSAAKRSNVDFATILQAAWWSNTETFNKFYSRPVQVKNNFGRDLLNSSPRNF